MDLIGYFLKNMTNFIILSSLKASNLIAEWKILFNCGQLLLRRSSGVKNDQFEIIKQKF